MKKFLQYILLFVLLSTLGIILTNKEQTRQAVRGAKTLAEKKLGIDQPCGKPLEYSIGNIDPGFNISQSELLQLSENATKIWNTAEGKILLKYNSASPFKINLIYDERQEQSNAASQLEENLSSLENTHEKLTQQYNSLNSQYKSKIDEYNRDMEDYKDAVAEYNRDVSRLNSQGGATPDEYTSLKKEKKELDEKFERLEAERKEINRLVSQTNSIASQENRTVENYNSNIQTYQNKYGGNREFEKGLFDGEVINIYEFREKNDLQLTLIHELGHYIGLGHTEEPESIMYPMIGEQDMENPNLSLEDLNSLQNICK